MWKIWKRNSLGPPKTNSRWDRTAKIIAEKIIRWRSVLVTRLERLDSKMSSSGRKVIFYAGILLWSTAMFCILGRAVRKPSGAFILPFAIDSSYRLPQKDSQPLRRMHTSDPKETNSLQKNESNEFK